MVAIIFLLTPLSFRRGAEGEVWEKKTTVQGVHRGQNDVPG